MFEKSLADARRGFFVALVRLSCLAAFFPSPLFFWLPLFFRSPLF